MGQHVWLLLATIITELLVIAKWSKDQFPEPLPSEVKWGWMIGATLLVLYPTVQVSYVLIRSYPSPSSVYFIIPSPCMMAD
jgi:phosphatidylserine synthase 2